MCLTCYTPSTGVSTLLYSLYWSVYSATPSTGVSTLLLPLLVCLPCYSLYWCVYPATLSTGVSTLLLPLLVCLPCFFMLPELDYLSHPPPFEVSVLIKLSQINSVLYLIESGSTSHKSRKSTGIFCSGNVLSFHFHWLGLSVFPLPLVGLSVFPLPLVGFVCLSTSVGWVCLSLHFRWLGLSVFTLPLVGFG